MDATISCVESPFSLFSSIFRARKDLLTIVQFYSLKSVYLDVLHCLESTRCSHFPNVKIREIYLHEIRTMYFEKYKNKRLFSVTNGCHTSRFVWARVLGNFLQQCVKTADSLIRYVSNVRWCPLARTCPKENETGNLAPKTKVLRWRHRHALHRGGGGGTSGGWPLVLTWLMAMGWHLIRGGG